MAASRLERIGTIYSRTKSLIGSGAMKWEDRPLWYDIYEAFPPREEPVYNRPAQNVALRKIFYEEDKLRALFHKRNSRIGSVNLSNESTSSVTQRFIEAYKKVRVQYGDDDEEQTYIKTIELLQRDRQQLQERVEEPIDLVSEFKEAERTKVVPNIGIKISEIMK